MKFKINNSEWEISIVSEAEMNNEEKNSNTLGLTNYRTQEIKLVGNNANILRTLKHELMHVWLWEYGHDQHNENAYDYEDVCNIVSSSNDFINRVVKKYKKEIHKELTKKEKTLCSHTLAKYDFGKVNMMYSEKEKNIF